MNKTQMFLLRFLSAILFLVFSALQVSAQDAHYYSQQPDSRGTLSGGTGTAGSRELSAVFYNPGIIALFEQSNVGLGGSLYTVDFINLYEGELPNRNLNGSTFQVIPSIIAGTFKWKNNKKFTSSYAYFNGAYYEGRFSSENLVDFISGGDLLNSLNRNDYRIHFSENWIGGGVSYRINEHWGIGVNPYVHIYSSNFMQRQYSDVSLANNPAIIISGNQDFRESRLFSPGLVLDLGLVYNKNGHEFGLTIISPRMNIKSLAYSSIERTLLTYDATGQVSNSIMLDPNFKAIVKRPLEINFGYALFRERRAFKVRLSYYSSIKSYVMGEESSSSFRSGVFELPNKYSFLPVISNRSTINLGIGHEWTLRKSLRVITGFRTDFSFFDKSQYKYFDLTPVLIHWDVYHFSVGVDWEYNWLKLSTGVDYGFSYDSKLAQYVQASELNKPVDEINFSNSAHVSYHQLKVFLGLVLSFNHNAE